MKIPDELMKKWAELRSHGDGRKIAESSGGKVTVWDVGRAFKKGECNDEVFQAIGDFFKEKDGKVKQYLNSEPQT